MSRVLYQGVLACVFVASMLASPWTLAAASKASSWVGRVVVTTEGDMLGRIEDFAIDVENKSVDFVVVSIGSFLIDNNLIAVHPDALGESSDGLYLVIYTDNLDGARRFGRDSWPSSPDVLPSADRTPVDVDGDAIAAEDGDGGFNDTRVATISSGNRTATMKEGDTTATIETSGPVETRRVEVAPKRYSGDGAPPLLADSEFERMDDDQDGYLSRREIGSRLSQDVSFSDYDFDGNDGIDPFEFQILKNDAG